MEERTRRFLRWKFASYYNTAIELPADFWMREFGFIFFDRSAFIRHLAFGSAAQIHDFLRKNAPAHAFYSSAIYERPAAKEMSKKGWLGADLIFDLDADHILGEEGQETERGRNYENMLRRVKQETKKLLNFLISDFGIEYSDIEVVFSGSRGYHIHVSCDAVRSLGSRERREIVDYLSARGLDLRGLLRSVERMCAAESNVTESGGWSERLFRGLLNFLLTVKERVEADEDAALDELMRIKGIGEKGARKIVALVKDDAKMEKIASGSLNQIPRIMPIWKVIIANFAVELGAKEDEPVTVDIHRLIRMPFSLHGKTGFIVKPVPLDDFDDFEPLEDAVAFSQERSKSNGVRVKGLRNASVRIKGQEYSVSAGEIVELPEHAAIYFLCRGFAEIF
ncbi:MAG: DNA primase catalytic subunit PriS [Candidatus Methanospirare jalkutatii]|nr:DNA primase catalytic subunit PriS [Candidatus Methanospirare jalkutatii]